VPATHAGVETIVSTPLDGCCELLCYRTARSNGHRYFPPPHRERLRDAIKSPSSRKLQSNARALSVARRSARSGLIIYLVAKPPKLCAVSLPCESNQAPLN
jgi:hypothetical protein